MSLHPWDALRKGDRAEGMSCEDEEDEWRATMSGTRAAPVGIKLKKGSGRGVKEYVAVG